MASEYDHLFKVLLIGDSGVGKSCLLVRYAENSFTESYISTVGVDFTMKTLNLQGKTIRLQLWDTAGQERFRTISSSYYRGAHGIIVVYDVTSKASFKNIDVWLKQIDLFAADSVNRIIVGTKSDLEEKREVDAEQAKIYAKEQGIPFMEVSAKTGANVETLFTKISTDIMERIVKSKPEPSGTRPDQKQIGIRPRDPPKDSCNC